jgi:hypothetical protein
VLSDNPQAVEVLRLFKPGCVFLAYKGRKLLETLKEFNVAVCTYIPFDVPRGAKTTDLPIFLETCHGAPPPASASPQRRGPRK